MDRKEEDDPVAEEKDDEDVRDADEEHVNGVDKEKDRDDRSPSPRARSDSRDRNVSRSPSRSPVRASPYHDESLKIDKELFTYLDTGLGHAGAPRQGQERLQGQAQVRALCSCCTCHAGLSHHPNCPPGCCRDRSVSREPRGRDSRSRWGGAARLTAFYAAPLGAAPHEHGLHVLTCHPCCRSRSRDVRRRSRSRSRCVHARRLSPAALPAGHAEALWKAP
jgi:hypothetical protein